MVRISLFTVVSSDCVTRHRPRSCPHPGHRGWPLARAGVVRPPLQHRGQGGRGQRSHSCRVTAAGSLYITAGYNSCHTDCDCPACAPFCSTHGYCRRDGSQGRRRVRVGDCGKEMLSPAGDVLSHDETIPAVIRLGAVNPYRGGGCDNRDKGCEYVREYGRCISKLQPWIRC